jgi:hypothetical protein
LQFGNEKRNGKIKLGVDCLRYVKKDIHLGVVLTNKSDCIDESVKERIQQCKNTGYAIQAIGSHNVPVTPKTSSKIYWSVCMPKLCYGTEVIDISENASLNMENYHCNMAKHSQNLSSQCSNSGSLATVGWNSVRSHCNFLKLIFLWQLLTLSVKSVYKEVCIKRLCLFFIQMLYGVVHYGTWLMYVQNMGFL